MASHLEAAGPQPQQRLTNNTRNGAKTEVWVWVWVLVLCAGAGVGVGAWESRTARPPVRPPIAPIALSGQWLEQAVAAEQRSWQALERTVELRAAVDSLRRQAAVNELLLQDVLVQLHK